MIWISDQKFAMKGDYKWFLHSMLLCWHEFVTHPWSRIFLCKEKVPKFYTIIVNSALEKYHKFILNATFKFLLIHNLSKELKNHRFKNSKPPRKRDLILNSLLWRNRLEWDWGYGAIMNNSMQWQNDKVDSLARTNNPPPLKKTPHCGTPENIFIDLPNF